MRPRLEDVAAHAGLSAKTVSRVLNNEPNVRESTRRRVAVSIEALDYLPNPSARSLAANRSFIVALLYDNPSPSYVMEVQTGVLQVCDSYSYGMMAQPIDSSSADLVSRVAKLISSRRPDGLVLTPPITEHPGVIAELRTRDIPFTCISPREPDTFSGVALDETAASCDMVEHLVSLGHTSIAHIIGHPRHGGSELRLKGYAEGLARSGLLYRESLVLQGQFSYQSGVECAHRFLIAENRPTAIFAANDDMAAGVISTALEMGLRIPDDLSVCGFDDTPISRQVWPSITTIHQPCLDMGRIAATELFKIIHHNVKANMVLANYSLCVRASTGKPSTSGR
ncbi:MAG: LacI family DNA-binding transcriptional regulator [Rhodanobacter sp.]|nr:MAG: LacI family DNA-binding transcriptional regulator [Rhodanobacter sp.]